MYTYQGRPGTKRAPCPQARAGFVGDDAMRKRTAALLALGLLAAVLAGCHRRYWAYHDDPYAYRAPAAAYTYRTYETQEAPLGAWTSQDTYETLDPYGNPVYYDAASRTYVAPAQQPTYYYNYDTTPYGYRTYRTYRKPVRRYRSYGRHHRSYDRPSRREPERYERPSPRSQDRTPPPRTFEADEPYQPRKSPGARKVVPVLPLPPVPPFFRPKKKKDGDK